MMKIGQGLVELDMIDNDDVLSLEDPLPALGILYLLAVFIKHGRISTELLVSEGATKSES